MENKELKPCPFCGGEAVLEHFKSRKGYEATIQCNGECVLYMSTITHDTEEEAIEAVTKAWNRRAENETNREKN
jgi:Lar family restriction alleviation protein